MKKLKICPQGHQFYKSSDCPTCPECAKQAKPQDGFLSLISAPARRAMQSKSISSLSKLAQFSEAEVLSWHGVGPSAIPILRQTLAEAGLKFAS